MFQLRLAAATLALTTLAVSAQDQQPAGTTAPTAVVSSDKASKKKESKKHKETKKDERVQQSKETKRDIKRLKKGNPLAGLDSTQPDKQLYDRSVEAMRRGKFDMARLELQTLLATYPDSEYQMRAKLAFADSWYKEGGSSALMQAEQEYKDFITFFPNAPEAAEAQLRVGDIYFKQMDTPDRDYTKALHAQEEYRNMLQQFPNSTLTDQARQRLREVQEVLAQRESEIAAFYATRENFAASIARYQTVVDSYPLYSRIDEVLIGLGDAYESEARFIRNLSMPEGPKAALIKIYEDDAADSYGRVVTQYAASAHVEDARDRLETIGRPIPTPTPEQLAASQALENSRQSYRLKDRVKLLFMRGPDTVEASRIGEPSLSDPKPTLAPNVARRTEEQFKSALAPNARKQAPANAAAPEPAQPVNTPTTAPAPTSTPAAAPAFSDIQDSGEAPATGSAVDMSAPANASPASNGGSVGATIVKPTNAPDNGLKAIGPTNNDPLPPVEAPEQAPDQVNAVADKTTPAAQAQPAKGKKAKAEFDDGEASSSKHKKKKGLKKINPF